MKRKNALEYIFLALFIMCMALSMSAALEYASVGTQRPYLLQGAWLLGLVALTLGVFIAVRGVNKVSRRMPEGLKTLLTAGLCAALFLVGLALRIAVIEKIPMEPESDYETYYRIATELVNDTLLTPQGDLDRRYVAMYPHTIGFPMLILQPAFMMFGESVRVAQYANLVCSMISILLCGHIGRRMAGRMGAVLATLMMSLWPSHILYANMVATEQSFTMFLLLAADIMVSILDRRRGSLYDRQPGRIMGLQVVLGIVLAVAGAIRPMSVLLLASYAVVQLMHSTDPEGVVKVNSARMAVSRGWFCVMMVVIPYLLVGGVISRAISDAIMEEPASGITASGYNLMVGVNVEAEGRWNETDSNFFGERYDTLGNANEAHSACMQVAIQRITQAPENVLNLLVFKFRDLWQTDDFGIDWNLQWADHQGTLTPELKTMLEAIRPGGRLTYMAVLLCALLCGLSTWRSKEAPVPMVMVSMIFFLGTALSHMLLETQVRYHYNMLPFFMLLATMGITSWRSWTHKEPAAAAAAGGAVPVSAEPEEVDGHEDNTRFDMLKALRDGNIILTVTDAFQQVKATEPKPEPEAVVPAAETLPAAEPEPVEAVEPESEVEVERGEAAEPEIEAEAEMVEAVEPEIEAEAEMVEAVEPEIEVEAEMVEAVEPEMEAEAEMIEEAEPEMEAEAEMIEAVESEIEAIEPEDEIDPEPAIMPAPAQTVASQPRKRTHEATGKHRQARAEQRAQEAKSPRQRMVERHRPNRTSARAALRKGRSIDE